MCQTVLNKLDVMLNCLLLNHTTTFLFFCFIFKVLLLTQQYDVFLINATLEIEMSIFAPSVLVVNTDSCKCVFVMIILLVIVLSS